MHQVRLLVLHVRTTRAMTSKQLPYKIKNYFLPLPSRNDHDWLTLFECWAIHQMEPI